MRGHRLVVPVRGIMSYEELFMYAQPRHKRQNLNTESYEEHRILFGQGLRP